MEGQESIQAEVTSQGKGLKVERALACLRGQEKGRGVGVEMEWRWSDMGSGCRSPRSVKDQGTFPYFIPRRIGNHNRILHRGLP